jgi:uncharacterized membrane protein
MKIILHNFLLSIFGAIRQLAKFIDDILFLLGVIFLTTGGFLIYIPVGFFILGICCIAYAFIFARSAAMKRGGS